MKCPFCFYNEPKVIDSRPDLDEKRIKRRRECLSCSKRFITYETVYSAPIIIIKKDNSREMFDRNKVLNGMLRACEKRPVSIERIEHAVDEIESALQSSLEDEIPSYKIGELAMSKLKELDEVAYVRFASVYRSFADIGAFMNELKSLIGENKTK